MEVSDSVLVRNRDWDPNYLLDLFSEDFYEFGELSKSSNMGDTELVQNVEKYCPTVEDISMDDVELCQAVDEIEYQ